VVSIIVAMTVDVLTRRMHMLVSVLTEEEQTNRYDEESGSQQV
jgi:hypothetical protein